MTHDNAYAAFMLDYAAGTLTPAERLAADLHRSLSPRGERHARLAESVGGVLLESEDFAPVAAHASLESELHHSRLPAPTRRPSELATMTSAELMALEWRRDIFGMWVCKLATPMGHLLRLNPGEHAPHHSHGRRDVTLVLRGSYSDEYGHYERGDLAFAEPGMKHTPEAVGEETCICFIATESGKPILGFLGLFGLFNGSERGADRRHKHAS